MVTASIDINNDSPADFGQNEEDWLSPKKSPADGSNSQYWETR